MKINKCQTFFILLFGFLACGPSAEEKSPLYISIQGPTMGTTYKVKAKTMLAPDQLQKEIDSLLAAFNLEVSTYIENSTISRFNQARDTFLYFTNLQPHFHNNLEESYELYGQTDGYFDPTVMPLVNYWGFGYEPRNKSLEVDSAVVDSLARLVGLSKINRIKLGDTVLLIKELPGLKLDFSAIAKGDGVDLISSFLEKKKISDYMVDIGGELYAEGVNPAGETWVIGINRPAEEAKATDIIEKIMLSGRGLATSGNYRNFYKVNEKVYSHTINPKTGYTERNQLLSATVLAENCMHADALATACMTMGDEKVRNMAPDWEKTAVFIVYQEGKELKTWSTKEFHNYIKE